jgi:hypothetical protein
VSSSTDLTNGTLPWGRAAAFAVLWGIVGLGANVVVWIATSPLSIDRIWFYLLLSSLFAVLLAAVVHRSGRVALLSAVFTLALSGLAFLVLTVLALTTIHWHA